VTSRQPIAAFISLDGELGRYVVQALSLGRSVLLDAGFPPPVRFDALVDRLDALNCQGVTPLGERDDDDDNMLVDIPKAARMLAVSERTVFRLLADGRLASVPIGRRRLIPVDAIAALAKEAS
jgi:excisionase family DNA binding protein